MSNWLARVLSAEPGFEQELVGKYTERLIELARRQLPERVQQRVGPEDVVQSVYRSFFQRLTEGQFAFDESHDIWRLLAAMTYHKVKKTIRFHLRDKRDIRREAPPQAREDGGRAADPAQGAPSGPKDVAVLFECLEELLLRVPESHRQIVTLRLQGHTIQEIAEKIGRSQRTVLRALERLEDLAGDYLEEEEA